jgi:hypothetical protein
MSIHIKPSHKGLLHHDLGIAANQSIPLSSMIKAKHSKSPAERKRATFAINARKWNHK